MKAGGPNYVAQFMEFADKRRRATRDIELGGKKLKEGDKAVMYFGSANRDPARWVRMAAMNTARGGFLGPAAVSISAIIARALFFPIS